MIHQDERRILEDWPEAKIITAKQDCILGNHYHKIKTEKFILVDGEASVSINSHVFIPLYKGEMITILPNEIHAFQMKQGARLIGLCSHPFDPTDDYR